MSFKRDNRGDSDTPNPSQDLETSIASLLAFQEPDGQFCLSVEKREHKADFYTTLFAVRALWEAHRQGKEVSETRLQASLDYLRGQIPETHKRAQGTMPNPWRPFHSDMLNQMGLPSKRNHPLQDAAVSPTSQVAHFVNSKGAQGSWTLMECTQLNLLAFQLQKTPYKDPRGVFRFGSATTMLGELQLSGDKTTPSRWTLPADLQHLMLEIEGEGHLFYRIKAHGQEPVEGRTTGYGLVTRTVNRKPPDENGEWHLKVGERLEVSVVLLFRSTRDMACYLPKPAACVDKSEKQILRSNRGHRSFDFRLEVRHPGRFVFPPAWLEGPDGVVARTDWHTLVVE